MELLLIRHGLPIRRELTEGIADPELAPDGLAQAALLGEYLASEHLDAVYASSLRRAQQTAEPVVVGRDLELRIEPDVAEFDKDSPEYVPGRRTEGEQRSPLAGDARRDDGRR